MTRRFTNLSFINFLLMERGGSYHESSQVAAFTAGDETGFDYFFNQWYKSCCAYAAGIVEDGSIAEDVVIDSFVRLWHHREQFNTAAEIKSYLFTIVHNQSLKYLRGRQRSLRREKVWMDAVDDESIVPLEGLIRAELYAQLSTAVESLPAQCSIIFRSLYFDGKSVREVAAELSTTIGNVKSQKNRGLILLRKFFSHSYILSILPGIYIMRLIFC